MEVGGGQFLEKMGVYTLQTEIADEIWDIVGKWNFFEKDTLGKQLSRAFDSIDANIAEGYGRFHYGDKIKFYYYARGSVYESQYWIKRACKRKLMTEKESVRYLRHLQQVSKGINTLIKVLKQRKQQS